MVVVSGASASGKTTLATRLAATLCVPLLSKDLYKEALFDALGTGDLSWSRRLGAASFELLYVTTERVIRAGGGLVIDANFQRGLSNARLRSLLDGVDATIVQCDCTPELVAARYAIRAAAGARHPGHLGAELVPEVIARSASGAFEPPECDVPVLRVDTTDGYRPSYEAIVDFVKEARRRRASFRAGADG